MGKTTFPLLSEVMASGQYDFFFGWALERLDTRFCSHVANVSNLFVLNEKICAQQEHSKINGPNGVGVIKYNSGTANGLLVDEKIRGGGIRYVLWITISQYVKWTLQLNGRSV